MTMIQSVQNSRKCSNSTTLIEEVHYETAKDILDLPKSLCFDQLTSYLLYSSKIHCMFWTSSTLETLFYCVLLPIVDQSADESK